MVECPDPPPPQEPESSSAATVGAVATDENANTCAAITDELAALQDRVKQAAGLLGGVSVAEKSSVEGINLRDWRANWYWYAIPVALLIGLILGIVWMDYRSRQRYGGVRV